MSIRLSSTRTAARRLCQARNLARCRRLCRARQRSSGRSTAGSWRIKARNNPELRRTTRRGLSGAASQLTLGAEDATVHVFTTPNDGSGTNTLKITRTYRRRTGAVSHLVAVVAEALAHAQCDDRVGLYAPHFGGLQQVVRAQPVEDATFFDERTRSQVCTSARIRQLAVGRNSMNAPTAV